MDSYIGTIMAWAPSYAPYGWMFCQGQSLPINQYAAVYALLGNKYGGTSTTFNLPDLRGRIPVGAGNNPNTGTAYLLGTTGGSESYTLLSSNLPPHTHTINSIATATANTASVNMDICIPVNTDAYNASMATNKPDSSCVFGEGKTNTLAPTNIYTKSNATNGASLKPFTAQTSVTIPAQNVTVASTCVPSTTQAIRFDLRQPYQCVNYIICVQGIYPTSD